MRLLLQHGLVHHLVVPKAMVGMFGFVEERSDSGLECLGLDPKGVFVMRRIVEHDFTVLDHTVGSTVIDDIPHDHQIVPRQFTVVADTLDLDAIGLTQMVNNLNHGYDLAGNPISMPTSILIGVGVNPCAVDLDR